MTISLHKLAAPVLALSLAILTPGDSRADQAAQFRTVVHAAGTTEVPVAPHKVVVFDTAALDTMDALDIPVAGVPQRPVALPPFLAKYQGKAYLDAGTLFEPAFEALSAAEPDLIIGGGRATKAYAELSRIAPTIDLRVDDARFLPSFHERTLQLGEIFGKAAEARAALDDLDRRTAAVRGKAPGTALLVLVTGGRISAYGPGSRFGFIYDALGFKPAVPLSDTGPHGNAMSFELLLQADPDWLFVVDRDAAIGAKGAASARQVLDNDLIRGTKAMRAGRVVYLDAGEMYLAGGLQTLRHLTETVNARLSADR